MGRVGGNDEGVMIMIIGTGLGVYGILGHNGSALHDLWKEAKLSGNAGE
jgi:hypothetical protein